MGVSDYTIGPIVRVYQATFGRLRIRKRTSEEIKQTKMAVVNPVVKKVPVSESGKTNNRYLGRFENLIGRVATFKLDTPYRCAEMGGKLYELVRVGVIVGENHGLKEGSGMKFKRKILKDMVRTDYRALLRRKYLVPVNSNSIKKKLERGNEVSQEPVNLDEDLGNLVSDVAGSFDDSGELGEPEQISDEDIAEIRAFANEDPGDRKRD